MAELEAAEEATEAAAKEARKKLREQRKAEVSEKFGERVGKLRNGSTSPRCPNDEVADTPVQLPECMRPITRSRSRPRPTQAGPGLDRFKTSSLRRSTRISASRSRTSSVAIGSKASLS
jgi:hypothetical protein